MRTCAREIVMCTAIILLFIIEILQFISLGPYTSLSELRFYFNFDNIIQLVVITLALASVATQHKEIHVKWCSAFGVVIAYIGNDILILISNNGILYYVRSCILHYSYLHVMMYLFRRIRFSSWPMSTTTMSTSRTKQHHVL